MRVERRRTKKLIVAFHFLAGRPAAWKCDDCRAKGLTEKRRCGWQAGARAGGAPVWAKRGLAIFECPTSYITAETLTFVEEYHARRMFGFGDVAALPARTVDAFSILERESVMERAHADK